MLADPRTPTFNTPIEMCTDVNAVPHASLSEKPKDTGFRAAQILKPPKV